ncbi:hypothetical protein FM036_04865 [Nostoc sp. HG1]|nr:hypothetical protein [Nostoc sp. HG1]
MANHFTLKLGVIIQIGVLGNKGDINYKGGTTGGLKRSQILTNDLGLLYKQQIPQSHVEVLESRVEVLESHVEVLESHVEVLESHVEVLESHVEVLESHVEVLEIM